MSHFFLSQKKVPGSDSNAGPLIDSTLSRGYLIFSIVFTLSFFLVFSNLVSTDYKDMLPNVIMTEIEITERRTVRCKINENVTSSVREIRKKLHWKLCVAIYP